MQLKHLAEKGDHKRVRILKARQQGFTTLYCIDYLDDALWNTGFSAAIISHDREHLDKIFQIIKRAYDNLPPEIKPETKQDTLRSYKFKQTFDGRILDSEIYVALRIRGGTVQALHISERAYIEGESSQELEAGSKQAVPLTGKISEETTVNGLNEFNDSFMDDWNSKTQSEYDYRSFFYAWHDNPEYRLPGKIEHYTEEDLALKELVRSNYQKELSDEQIMWYNWKAKDIEKAARASDERVVLNGRQLMKQEYPSSVLEAFQSAAGNVFDSTTLQKYMAKEPIRIMRSTSVQGQVIRIWEEPKTGKRKNPTDPLEPRKNYFMAADPSDGIGGSNGAIAVWNEDYQKVAEWHGMLRPDRMAVLAKEIGEFYNHAFAGIENNMLSMILEFSKIYDNYFSTVTIDERYQRRTKKMGWTTTSKSRDVMIDDYIRHFEEQTLQINSNITLSEMGTFVIVEGGRREHAIGKKDDMLMADMIAIQMIKYKDRSKSISRVFERPSGF